MDYQVSRFSCILASGPFQRVLLFFLLATALFPSPVWYRAAGISLIIKISRGVGYLLGELKVNSLKGTVLQPCPRWEQDWVHHERAHQGALAQLQAGLSASVCSRAAILPGRTGTSHGLMSRGSTRRSRSHGLRLCRIKMLFHQLKLARNTNVHLCCVLSGIRPGCCGDPQGSLGSAFG